MKKRLQLGVLKRKRSKTPKVADGIGNHEKMNDINHTTQTLAGSFERNLHSLGDAQKDYERHKKDLIERESLRAWDRKAKLSASELEIKADKITWKIREHERDNLFGNKASEAIPGPETLDMGGQFLTNLERVRTKSALFQISKKMPKGCHLHLHFNSELIPEMLITKADEIPNMYIRSTQPLLKDQDYAETEMVFSVLPVDTPSADPFSPTYNPDWKTPGAAPWMKWTEFQKEFESRQNQRPKEWIKNKMVLSDEEAYGPTQTTNGVWARFNQATRCFKGLMNYESVYKWYIGAAIDSMIQDGVMYAELRPMLLDKFIPANDGIGKLNHGDQMRIILQEVKRKQDELRERGLFDKFPFGLKIIYCAPRSIPKPMMHREIQDCIQLKLDFPNLICGFDLVGAEDRPNHVGYYRDELLAMVQTCKELKIEIPFMFHAGETLLDMGGSKNPANSNLYDAVLFNAKRIGHGFAILKHPVLAEEFRKRPICVELCPTSNELLHLCRNIKEHPYPEILAMNIPCTVNSDNPSLFTNSVSHEFYQVMVGSPTMNIHGWRQLAEWSIQYSCLDENDQIEARRIFKKEWEEFCGWIIDTYGEYAEALDVKI